MNDRIKLKKGHYTADSVILWCFDHRNWDAFNAYIAEKGIQHFDLISVAGGTKNLVSPKTETQREYVLDQIATSISLHGTKNIILMNHEDCGGYGGSKSFDNNKNKELEFHESELKKAKEIIQQKFPSTPVKTVFLEFDGLKEY